MRRSLPGVRRRGSAAPGHGQPGGQRRALRPGGEHGSGPGLAGGELDLLRRENDSPPFTREELEKIWERFYRREEDRSGRGTGLGLAITRQIVELHGGRCRAENIPGGVRFQLSVPN